MMLPLFFSAFVALLSFFDQVEDYK
ncbi:hypothetical protein PBAL39_20520 [Pedobacter sp. BAL39]|nr:hypothetical protein PBAL39_20520 [Pedobacter sp. BAL39]